MLERDVRDVAYAAHREKRSRFVRSIGPYCSCFEGELTFLAQLALQKERRASLGLGCIINRENRLPHGPQAAGLAGGCLPSALAWPRAAAQRLDRKARRVAAAFTVGGVVVMRAVAFGEMRGRGKAAGESYVDHAHVRLHQEVARFLQA